MTHPNHQFFFTEGRDFFAEFLAVVGIESIVSFVENEDFFSGAERKKIV